MQLLIRGLTARARRLPGTFRLCLTCQLYHARAQILAKSGPSSLASALSQIKVRGRTVVCGFSRRTGRSRVRIGTQPQRA